MTERISINIQSLNANADRVPDKTIPTTRHSALPRETADIAQLLRKHARRSKNPVLQRAEANGFDLSCLTERERGVFDLVVQQGKRERDVARMMGISKGVVRDTKRSISGKLGVKSLCRVEEPLPDITLKNPKAQAALRRLTRKEKEVFILVLQHETKEDIARTMNIDEPAVRFHERHILAKLGMPSTARLISTFGDDEGATLEKLESGPVMRKALEKGLSPRREQLIELVEQRTLQGRSQQNWI